MPDTLIYAPTTSPRITPEPEAPTTAHTWAANVVPLAPRRAGETLGEEVNNLLLSNLHRGAHAMTLVGGGLVATGSEALLCAFAAHPFDDRATCRRRVVRQVWKRAGLHCRDTRWARGVELVESAAETVRDYYQIAFLARETEFLDTCFSVLAAALFDDDPSATADYVAQGLEARDATRLRAWWSTPVPRASSM